VPTDIKDFAEQEGADRDPAVDLRQQGNEFVDRTFDGGGRRKYTEKRAREIADNAENKHGQRRKTGNGPGSTVQTNRNSVETSASKTEDIVELRQSRIDSKNNPKPRP
jgi:hypothetical protein